MFGLATAVVAVDATVVDVVDDNVVVVDVVVDVVVEDFALLNKPLKTPLQKQKNHVSTRRG